jgi:hypothetical protein
MANFWITSKTTPEFRMQLADCTFEHAKSVRQTMIDNVTDAPLDLFIYQVDDLYEPTKKTLKPVYDAKPEDNGG